MSNMGSTCSMQRHSSSRRNSRNLTTDNHLRRMELSRSRDRRLSRHSVIQQLPDASIAQLYPPEDNYIAGPNGTRSPKSLAELCTDTLCRSLAYLEGELPPGLPQEVVDELVASLVKHNALNATTLRVFKNCELGSLSLAGCRGVTDEWLEPFHTPTSSHSSSFHNTVEDAEMSDYPPDEDNRKPPPVYYDASANESQQEEVSSSSTCDTFVSASSTLQATAATVDQEMKEAKQYEVEASDSSYQFELSDFGAVPSSTSSNITVLDLRGSQRLTDKGLIKLTGLNALEVARLDNCFSVIGKGLLAFSSSFRLHTLSLANCRRLSDEAIINISHLNSLEALSLDGCRCLTDRSIAAIAGLLRLKKLNLSQCDLISDAGLEELEELEQLEELSLGWCSSISDEGLDVLTKQPRRSQTLKILCLARCLITDVGTEHLSRLHALQELDVNGCPRIGSTALGKALSQMPNLACLDVSYCPGIIRSSWQGQIKALKQLDLCYSGVRDSHLGQLTHLPALEVLSLDSSPVGDWAIAHLANNNVVPNLKSLDLADTELTDLGMVHLAKFQSLQRLSLFYCNISSRGLRHLAKLTSLEVLNLDSREIDDSGLVHLRHLTKLKSLDVFSGRITDAGCSHIARIKSLENLELCGGGVGDLGCAILATLHNLTALNLSQNDRISNRGAASLAALSKLKHLNLSNTRVTSGGLVHFRDMVSLQSLALYGCHGVKENKSLDRLQNDLPRLRCVRMNNIEGADEDGKMRRMGDETESDNDDDDDVEVSGESDQDEIMENDYIMEHDSEESSQYTSDEEF
eukprot:Nitzschia sp. Nitz4//scaffold14_size191712//154002//156659//NITZ4_001750-RA/size191712-processed-gene-0.80-mRNA-1//-1//CDS//3329537008//9034//frame0